MLNELRSRPLYTEVETIENDRCYVIRGYFSGTPSGITDDIYVVYKYGGTRDLYSSVYPYFSVVDSIGFSEERDYMLTVKGRVLSEDKENYTDATAEINIYSYAKKDTNVPGGPTDLPEESKKLIRSMLRWDDPRSIYSIYADELVYVPDTFYEEALEYLEDYSKIDENWDHGRPALMWYLVQEMDLTLEDIEKYFAAFDSVYADLGIGGKVPEKIYEGLMADTLEESMQLLKSDYAFYYDGELYTIYRMEDMILNDTLPFDITDPAYDEVWKNISDFWETQPYCNLWMNTYYLIRERAHDPVKRLYFYYYTQTGNTWSSYRSRPDVDYYSILDCDTYEAAVSSMNGRYALVHDGTYFIYDYLNGEKVCDIPFSPDEYRVEFIEFGSKDLPRYLNVGNIRDYDGNSLLMYDTENQAFVSDEKYYSCVIPLATDLLCITVKTDGKYITTAYRVGTCEKVFSVEGHIYSAEIDEKTVLAVKEYPNSNDVIAFYDTDGNELTGLDEYKTELWNAPRGNHLIYRK